MDEEGEVQWPVTGGKRLEHVIVGNSAEPDIHDIGILASTDPVVLDQACIDLVWQAEGNASLVRRVESRDGLHTLEYAAEIGLGSRTYNLVDLDT